MSAFEVIIRDTPVSRSGIAATVTGNELAFLDLICGEFDNTLHRLVYADWLEDQGLLTEAQLLRHPKFPLEGFVQQQFMRFLRLNNGAKRHAYFQEHWAVSETSPAFVMSSLPARVACESGFSWGYRTDSFDPCPEQSDERDMEQSAFTIHLHEGAESRYIVLTRKITSFTGSNARITFPDSIDKTTGSELLFF